MGEGFGSSIKMSEWRASEDALRRLYLGGREKGGLPSDEWVKGASAFVGIKEGETEGAFLRFFSGLGIRLMLYLACAVAEESAGR